MPNQSNQQNIKIIYRMLFEMATGNLAFRILLDGNNQQLEELAEMLNKVAAKMQFVISQLENANPDYTSLNSTTHVQSEAVLLQNVYEYILNHLDEPLPSTKELSQLFGTNEFKLKDSFRHFFKTSIYKLYTDERLKKAHQLIQSTNISLKEIAFMSGFNDYTNFYKSFKKKYGYSPSDLPREANS
jgi:transcriptional regulator GlxA family with amidase domain